ncbi:MAG: DUF362 domain-containing protein [Candidatus Nezhaarchaeota archaeon]|nr:DUF362 domain-containing protein [Candidatus Nezhaarchaeota archaeon]MCX8141178.1 DUF362 domain-containing protein [Candidatus Nezhaarchaeota archaeon]MDW8050819.1 DUF362 domain-containing protein [Nitrososphaerota archaeon]
MTAYVILMVKVALFRGSDPIEVTVKALEAIESDLSILVHSNNPILIKPNYITADHPSTGITTDARVIEGVVKFLKERGVSDIVIGEGSGLADTFEAFRVAGVDEVAERWNVKLVDLNKDVFIEVCPPNPLALKRVKVAKIALERVIISVPKLKVHRLATVSLSLKNMMGALASKGGMHNGRLHENIADLASVLKPSLAVIDGIVAGEVHETSGSPVQMNVVIASADPVAADAVGAMVMGVKPDEVKHLVLAEKKGLGTTRLEEIEIVGEPIEKVARRFRRSLLSKLLSWI